MLDAEIGAVGDLRGWFKIRDFKDIKLRKKRSPGFGKRFKKSFKKVWVIQINIISCLLTLLFRKRL